ncbi:hypothetical protein AGLY_012784 [Aphis glycines]|uniref:Uncharacterized protein n=1 Tax=Aphis glycines TaxID=307491 RepID=A0A6G0T895_APHGL|nr:hypothetical protein AGLY_012784 [Aphis glycines]
MDIRYNVVYCLIEITGLGIDHEEEKILCLNIRVYKKKTNLSTYIKTFQYYTEIDDFYNTRCISVLNVEHTHSLYNSFIYQMPIYNLKPNKSPRPSSESRHIKKGSQDISNMNTALTDFEVGVRLYWCYTQDIRTPLFLQYYFSYTSFAIIFKQTNKFFGLGSLPALELDHFLIRLAVKGVTSSYP